MEREKLAGSHLCRIGIHTGCMGLERAKMKELSPRRKLKLPLLARDAMDIPPLSA